MPMAKKMAIATSTAKKVAEEEYDEDQELSDLLNAIYESLSEDNKLVFEQLLEEDPDQMIEFLEQLELQDGEQNIN